MPGWLTNGVGNLAQWTGNEQASFDTTLASGASPQTVSASLTQLANAIAYYSQVKDKTMVAGTRYYSSIVIGQPAVFTGIQALVGTTGGTDLWNFELHSPTGTTLATTLLTGTTAGTASTWQQIAFTATYTLTTPGTYFLVVQSNGTTAKLATLNSATNPTLTGSATGTLGTAASITPPTTYTANLGPVAMLY
jgi:hypothetical protein